MFSITTVCHRTSDTRYPLLVITNREGNRFFFGKVPEGSQRYLNENGFKMSKVKSIFMTGTICLWSEIGGLPGLFLTVSDAVVRGLDVYVSSSTVLKYIVATWRYFVFRRGCPLNVLAAEDGKVVADSSAAIFPVQIAPQQAKEPIEVNEKDLNDGNPVEPETFRSKTIHQLDLLLSTMFPPLGLKANANDESSTTEANFYGMQSHVKLPKLSEVVSSAPQNSLSYILRFLPTRGKFNPARAIELGIKPGVAFRELSLGRLVVNNEGEMIHSHQVLGENKTFPKVAIIDIPDQTYLNNTITSPEWFKDSEDRGSEKYGLVYHFLGDGIDLQLPQYFEFILKFPADCIHVIDHDSIADNTLSFRTSAIHLLKLKTISNGNFNLPYTEQARASPGLFVKLRSLQTYKIDSSGIKADDSDIQNDTWESLFEEHVKCLFPDLTLSHDIVPLGITEGSKSFKDDVQVVTLGTGSALPSIHRNVLSNLIRIPYKDPISDAIRFRGILLDGGESTLGMLLRNFGHHNRAQLKQVLDELCLIYLSHLHADHNLGIISVIREWLQHHSDNDRKLYLIIPWQYRDFLNEWFQLENGGSFADLDRIQFISCEQVMRQKSPETVPLSIDTFEKWFKKPDQRRRLSKAHVPALSDADYTQLQADTSIIQIQTCSALHCNWSYSVSMTFQLGNQETFKVSFSGDTRPNPKFVEVGEGSDLLIHEASLDDVNIEEALLKKHTTVTEAIRVGQLMNCRNIILTHFSTRSSEKPNFFMSSEEFDTAAQKLKSYLGPRTGNIFAGKDDEKLLGFDDLNVCYAYDFMSVRLNEIGFQKPHLATINTLSLAADSAVQMKKEQKEERKQIRQFEKRDTKRQQRLAAGQ